MSEDSETFDAFLNKWKNERIQPLGSRSIETDDRDYVIAERASELIKLCRGRGSYAELVGIAQSFGGIEGFVRHLIEAGDSQGTTVRPTAHDGADD